jgi:DNA polymerase III subunit epsilon
MTQNRKYAIIDIETTGGRADQERIIEIAIILHDGTKVIDSFESLVNPGRSIPWNITQITGINDSMVRGQPKFYEIAKKIVQMTEGAIFVAHNVRFDYSFVAEEFRSLGYTYQRKQLCTVKLARASFPGLKSYALGNLIRHFDIEVDARHRAMADTYATTIIFEKILQNHDNHETIDELINYGIKTTKIPKSLDLDKLHEIPEDCGVYYMHNEHLDVLYVGKSKNIKKRIFEHFNDKTSKGNLINNLVHDITYTVTGSELVSLLLESNEIKKLKPSINKSQKNTNQSVCVFVDKNEDGYLKLDIGGHAKIETANAKSKGKKRKIIKLFTKQSDARNFVEILTKTNLLCHCINETPKQFGCIHHQIGNCNGAAKGNETPESYNDRFLPILEKSYPVFEQNMLIIDKGRDKDESSVIQIENGKYQGFGFINPEETNSIEEMLECIDNNYNNEECNYIVQAYLLKNKGLRVIKY